MTRWEDIEPDEYGFKDNGEQGLVVGHEATDAGMAVCALADELRGSL
jgi:hypothetical protein